MQANTTAKSIVIPADLIRDRILDSGQTAALLGFSVPHFRRLYRAGQVPQPIRLSTRKLGWKAGTLSDWLAAKERV